MSDHDEEEQSDDDVEDDEVEEEIDKVGSKQCYAYKVWCQATRYAFDDGEPWNTKIYPPELSFTPNRRHSFSSVITESTIRERQQLFDDCLVEYEDFHKRFLTDEWIKNFRSAGPFELLNTWYFDKVRDRMIMNMEYDEVRPWRSIGYIIREYKRSKHEQEQSDRRAIRKVQREGHKKTRSGKGKGNKNTKGINLSHVDEKVKLNLDGVLPSYPLEGSGASMSTMHISYIQPLPCVQKLPDGA